MFRSNGWPSLYVMYVHPSGIRPFILPADATRRLYLSSSLRTCVVSNEKPIASLPFDQRAIIRQNLLAPLAGRERFPFR